METALVSANVNARYLTINNTFLKKIKMKNSSAALGDDVLFSSTNVFCTMKLQPIIYLLRLPKSGAPISCSLCPSHSLFLIINLTNSIPGQ